MDESKMISNAEIAASIDARSNFCCPNSLFEITSYCVLTFIFSSARDFEDSFM